MQDKKIPLLDCPVDYLIGDASGKIMNEYGRFPCKIKCGVFAFMVRGTAKATINITRYDVREHDVLLIEPGSFLLIHEFSEDALVYYILFSSTFLDRHAPSKGLSLENLQMKHPIVHLEQEYAEVMTEVVQVMMKAMNTRPSMLNSDSMVHVFNMLCSSYASYAKSEKGVLVKGADRRTEIYQEYSKLVLNNYQRWHHVSQYADAMHITLPHLCSTIKAVSGKTAGEVITEALVTDAKAQLKITSLQIKEIALSMGFDNIAFFNRFFKSHVGVTPKEYRNS